MVGQTIYVLDANRRVYRNDDGTARQTPNPRKYFVPVVVTGETARSWLLDDGDAKVNKKTLLVSGRYRSGRAFLSAQDVEDWIWDKEHRYDVIRLVERADAVTLRQIAALVGYQE